MNNWSMHWFSPIFVNSQTGKDYLTEEEQFSLLSSL